MHDAVARMWRLYNTDSGKKMIRYSMVSAISTLMAFTVLGIVFGVLRLWTEVPSAIFANVVMIVPNYYLNRAWVWGKFGRSSWRREVLPFWIISVWGIVLSIATAAVAHHVSVANHLSHNAATTLLLTITLLAFGVVWALKFLIFNRMFRVVGPRAHDRATDPTPDVQPLHKESSVRTDSDGVPPSRYRLKM
jgi:putative flippase GtrA